MRCFKVEYLNEWHYIICITPSFKKSFIVKEKEKSVAELGFGVREYHSTLDDYNLGSPTFFKHYCRNNGTAPDWLFPDRSPNADVSVGQNRTAASPVSIRSSSGERSPAPTLPDPLFRCSMVPERLVFSVKPAIRSPVRPANQDLSGESQMPNHLRRLLDEWLIQNPDSPPPCYVRGRNKKHVEGYSDGTPARYISEGNEVTVKAQPYGKWLFMIAQGAILQETCLIGRPGKETVGYPLKCESSTLYYIWLGGENWSLSPVITKDRATSISCANKRAWTDIASSGGDDEEHQRAGLGGSKRPATRKFPSQQTSQREHVSQLRRNSAVSSKPAGSGPAEILREVDLEAQGLDNEREDEETITIISSQSRPTSQGHLSKTSGITTATAVHQPIAVVPPVASPPQRGTRCPITDPTIGGADRSDEDTPSTQENETHTTPSIPLQSHCSNATSSPLESQTLDGNAVHHESVSLPKGDGVSSTTHQPHADTTSLAIRHNVLDTTGGHIPASENRDGSETEKSDNSPYLGSETNLTDAEESRSPMHSDEVPDSIHRYGNNQPASKSVPPSMQPPQRSGPANNLDGPHDMSSSARASSLPKRNYEGMRSSIPSARTPKNSCTNRRTSLAFITPGPQNTWIARPRRPCPLSSINTHKKFFEEAEAAMKPSWKHCPELRGRERVSAIHIAVKSSYSQDRACSSTTPNRGDANIHSLSYLEKKLEVIDDCIAWVTKGNKRSFVDFMDIVRELDENTADMTSSDNRSKALDLEAVLTVAENDEEEEEEEEEE
ncbi:hypothetical protein UCRPC4_g00516 [Phaeomoniella chlamydospora]|uniref:Uncharacterized protein n=1 Tax=Phaeomoniella chlamydospora TaxID=158046 RepID=A0A0G2F2Q6_PHACM|nr:hypothetical protein UCRPC4_g00516 [Phaeomoniella chlamydospora]